MHTFIIRPEDALADTVSLTEAEAHHAVDVLRLGKSEIIRAVDGRGTAYICEISAVTKKRVEGRVIRTLKNDGEATISVTLAAGLSSASKFDTIIEKATEAGVDRFVPLLTEKGKVKIDGRGVIRRKMKRWNRIASAAVKQSGRSRIPGIDEPQNIRDFIRDCRAASTILFHPENRVDNLFSETNRFSGGNITLLVGPESGFSKSELESAREAGIACMSLGSRILRTETAAVLIPAMIIYMAEMLNA